jgi:single-stranded-DNA-specific exonuclease
MPNLPKRWDTYPPISPETEAALQSYSPTLRQILANRGLTDAQSAAHFLKADYPAETETARMAGLPQAVARIRSAVKKNELVAVYGDYDVDGVTAAALLFLTLTSMGARVVHYIPDRFAEGYGLNRPAIENLHDQGVKLIITVDCGIRSLDEAAFAGDLGIDMVISDHHQPGAELPEVLAILNPKQDHATYPEKNLAGVGLAYKLAAALLEGIPGLSIQPADLLDLVALGTVADMAPLTGENRALVRAGLRRIRIPSRQGLLALMGVSGLVPQRARAVDIGFILGPRLNAPGRLAHANAAFELLTTSNVSQAALLAQQLDNLNRERQKITREIQSHAESQAGIQDPSNLILFAADPGYNQGVLGLAASRLTNQYYRPAVVGHQGETALRASCRSIPEFHITDALDQCADLLVQYGGHAAAAGFTVTNENLNPLLERLRSIAKDHLGHLELRPNLIADLETPLADLTADLLRDLADLEPTGKGNAEPLFISRDLRVVRSRAVGKDKAHLKLTVSDGNVSREAIAFRQGDWQGLLPPRIDLIFNFETNEYNGQTSLQLNVKDIKPTRM